MYTRLASFASLALLAAACQQKPAETAMTIQYPTTEIGDSVSTHFGIEVHDRYRWLENDTSAATVAWVKAQNKVTYGYLDQIPFRAKIKEAINENINFARYSLPLVAGKYLVYGKNDGQQNQSVYYIQEGETGKPEVLLDPNTLSAEGTTSYNIQGQSPDEKLVGFAVSKAGSDWETLKVMDLATRQFLPDSIEWAKATGMSFDAQGFYYSRYDKPAKGKELSNINTYHKVYYHKLGTAQEADVLAYADTKHALRYHSVAVSEDQKYHYLYISEGTYGTEIRYRKAGNPAAPFLPLCPGFANSYEVVGNVGDKQVVLTDNEAPNKRLVLIDPAKPTAWQTLIPEGKEPIEGASMAGGKLIITRLKDVCSQVSQYDLTGHLEHTIELPGKGAAAGFGGRMSSKGVYYQYTSYTYPRTLFYYDIATGKSRVFIAPKLDFNPEEYESKQVFYPSKDGTKIPMFITYRKGITLDGSHPTLLYAYGGFNVSLNPAFSAFSAAKLKMGMVLAVANLRGGGEYGEAWHKAGMLQNKQNVFDDFIAAAQYLCTEKYTSPERLAIQGGSNGGLLIGAVMTQRPDLCKVAIPEVGVLDMLRYHKFTLGWGWMVEYGNPDSSEHFKTLYAYSPLHNLKKGTSYPATLICTADHDDRVVPAHSFKFAAELQRCHTGANPVLIRINTDAGHGGSSLSKAVDEEADQTAFIFHNVGVEPKLGK